MQKTLFCKKSLVFLLLVIFAGGISIQIVVAKTYSFYGYVYDAETEDALSGVNVYLYAQKVPPGGWNLKDTDITDSNGRYDVSFDTWGDGCYSWKIAYSKPWYQSEWVYGPSEGQVEDVYLESGGPG